MRSLKELGVCVWGGGKKLDCSLDKVNFTFPTLSQVSVWKKEQGKKWGAELCAALDCPTISASPKFCLERLPNSYAH